MTLYVLLNGPKRSGKSSCANALANTRSINASISVIGFSFHLKKFVHGIYLGMRGFRLDPDHFDAVKEHPQEILDGMSWRQAYIHYSEHVIKPLHGKEWFGRMLVQQARIDGADIIIVPDSGFREEAEAVVREAAATNILLIRLHRPGHGFEGDSRSYIDLSDLDVVTHDVESQEGALDLTAEIVVGIIKEWHRHAVKR